MKPLSRGRLILARPPFSNAYGHPHRRLANPSAAEPSFNGQQSDQPTEQSDEQPDDLTPDENGDQEIQEIETAPERPEQPEVPVSRRKAQFELDELPAQAVRLPGLVRNDDELIIREFDSFYDFVLCAADDSLYAWQHTRKSHATKDRPNAPIEWYGTPTFDKAIDLALHGWPEGRRLLSDAFAQIIPQTTTFHSQSFEVAGAYSSVPAYCAGDPACMIEFQNDHIASRPVICINYNRGVPWLVNIDSIALYGAAVLSLMIELEALGHSVELRITSEVEANLGTAPAHQQTFIYKKAGENLDLDRAAFALIHPSLLRRLTFAIREQHANLEPAYYDNYGVSRNSQPTDELTIQIPGLRNNLDVQTAKTLVERAASAFLQQKDLAA